MVGEQLGNKAETFVGLVLNLKPQFDKFGIWLINADDESEIATIKAMLIKDFAVDEAEIEFQAFHVKKEEKKDGWESSRGDRPRVTRGGTRGYGRGRGGGGRDNFARQGENNFHRADFQKDGQKGPAKNSEEQK